MPTYDSDEDLDDFIETKVLLGFAADDPAGDPVSHLGGAPAWPHPASAADARLAKCAVCNKLMSLLLQLNGAIPESPHDRVFYVFGCKEKTCRRKPGSVRALRAVTVSREFVEREEKARREERRSEDAAPAAAKPAEQLTKTFAETLKIGVAAAPAPEPLLYGPSEPWPAPAAHQYPLFYLDADFETLARAAPAVDQKILELLDDEGAAGEAPASNSDADDGVLDAVFQKFADRAGQNPEQVLRYERGGAPLLYSDADAVARVLLDARGEHTSRKLPACGECGRRERVFEFQLMPHAITELERDSMGLDGMEWGTIVVATCVCTPRVRDANGVGWVEEWVGVQWEGQR